MTEKSARRNIDKYAFRVDKSLINEARLKAEAENISFPQLLIATTALFLSGELAGDALGRKILKMARKDKE